jgi:hypothetical protein
VPEGGASRPSGLFGVWMPGTEGFATSVPFGFGFDPPRCSSLMAAEATVAIGRDCSATPVVVADRPGDDPAGSRDCLNPLVASARLVWKVGSLGLPEPEQSGLDERTLAQASDLGRSSPSLELLRSAGECH